MWQVSATPFVAEATVPELSLIAAKLTALDAKVMRLEAKNEALERAFDWFRPCLIEAVLDVIMSHAAHALCHA